MTGYVVDFDTMVQTKVATGFQRGVMRIVPTAPEKQPKEAKEQAVDPFQMVDSLPEEISGEPQMILVPGDVVQISTQREDGLAFGTKVSNS